MFRFLLICLGGALGTGARALVMQAAPRLLGLAFPYGTLIVNVVGSFLISLIMALSLHGAWISPTLRMVLTTGFLGGLTTYSTFSYETLESLRRGAWLLGVLNLAATTITCLLAGLAGLACARAFLPR